LWDTSIRRGISAIFCHLVCFLSPNLANIIQLWYFYIIMNGLRRFERRFHQVWKQCSVFYLRYCVLRYFVKYGAIAMARRFSARQMPLLRLPMYLDYSIQK
jgi:hypothetical protein